MNPPTAPPTISPRLEVGDILRRHGADFLQRHALAPRQRQVVHALAACRTAALGGHLEVCGRCGQSRPCYNSCRDRHCPKCQTRRRRQWREARRAVLPDVGYFHVVFTLPRPIADLALPNAGGTDAVRRLIYRQLFASAWAAVAGAAPNALGAGLPTPPQSGMIAVLHTWGQKLQHHPHLHCLIPAGAWDADQGVWRDSGRDFFVPPRQLADRFRDHFLKHLRRQLQKLNQPDSPLAAPDSPLATQRWVVYVKPPIAAGDRGRDVLLGYLARYTYRAAFSNNRLVDSDDSARRGSPDPATVAFRYKDYRRGGRWRRLTLPAHEFIGRFLLHVLPTGFRRIRHFGLLGSHQRDELARVRAQLASARAASPETQAAALALLALWLALALRLLTLGVVLPALGTDAAALGAGLPTPPPPCCPHCGQPLCRIANWFGEPRHPRTVWPFDSS